MAKKINRVAILVRDYDEAIEYYTTRLGFTLVSDEKLSETKRWVLVAPNADSEFCLLLAQASNEDQVNQIGNQSGGRVFLFLNSDDFQKDYQDLLSRGVEFIREPVKESWGWAAVFKDLYGNLWDLTEI